MHDLTRSIPENNFTRKKQLTKNFTTICIFHNNKNGTITFKHLIQPHDMWMPHSSHYLDFTIKFSQGFCVHFVARFINNFNCNLQTRNNISNAAKASHKHKICRFTFAFNPRCFACRTIEKLPRPIGRPIV